MGTCGLTPLVTTWGLFGALSGKKSIKSIKNHRRQGYLKKWGKGGCVEGFRRRNGKLEYVIRYKTLIRPYILSLRVCSSGPYRDRRS